MIRSILRNAGIRPGRLFSAIRGWKRYVEDRKRFRSLYESENLEWGRELPILNEWNETSGGLGAYFLQDLTVARWVLEAAPKRHVDVGSRIDGFIGHLAVFREVDVIDIRPSPATISGIHFHQLDMMEKLPTHWAEYADSLSCLHSIEHFGLGRYGDELDPNGHLKGLIQLKRMVKPGGTLYLSAPIGPPRIEFNAHRVFAAQTLLDWFSDGWNIEKFAIIDDNNRLTHDVNRKSKGVSENFGCSLGVGILAARKAV